MPCTRNGCVPSVKRLPPWQRPTSSSRGPTPPRVSPASRPNCCPLSCAECQVRAPLPGALAQDTRAAHTNARCAKRALPSQHPRTHSRATRPSTRRCTTRRRTTHPSTAPAGRRPAPPGRRAGPGTPSAGQQRRRSRACPAGGARGRERGRGAGATQWETWGRGRGGARRARHSVTQLPHGSSTTIATWLD